MQIEELAKIGWKPVDLVDETKLTPNATKLPCLTCLYHIALMKYTKQGRIIGIGLTNWKPC
jgi:hypothetical protein